MTMTMTKRSYAGFDHAGLPRRKRLIAQHNVDGQHTVQWFKSGRTYHIVYGSDVVKTNDDLHAARSFAYAVHHQIECDGRLDHD